MPKNKIVVGIDQSYKNTGISIAYNNQIKAISSVRLEKYKNNSERRDILRKRLRSILTKMKEKSINNNDCELIVLIERIRLRSQGFINIDYIKSIGALNALIVDECERLEIECYSVDTRSWKSQIVGTSKPQKNKIGIDPEKWPTIKHVINLGFEDKILVQVSNKKKKGVFEKNGLKYTYNDDAADSACIALYGFCPNHLLEKEH